MPSTDRDRMDPGFEWRLKAALDRITPPPSLPRYAALPAGRVRAWRVAPLLLGAGTVVLLGLTATATTGSTNPVVWTHDATSTIGSVGHAPEASPSPQASPAQPPAPPRQAAAPATHQPEHSAPPGPAPTEHPEDSPRSQPTMSPSPPDDHDGSPSPSPGPSPSPVGGSGDH